MGSEIRQPFDIRLAGGMGRSDYHRIIAPAMIGQTISHYRVVEKLGPMGVVYKSMTKLAA